MCLICYGDMFENCFYLDMMLVTCKDQVEIPVSVKKAMLDYELCFENCFYSDMMLVTCKDQVEIPVSVKKKLCLIMNCVLSPTFRDLNFSIDHSLFSETNMQ